MNLVFIQSGGFVADMKRLRLTDEDLRQLEIVLMGAPAAGAVMAGAGSLRKLRFAPPTWHTGKSGALRVCYAWFPDDAIIYLVCAFGKNEQSNLSAHGKAAARRLIHDIGALLKARRIGHGKTT